MIYWLFELYSCNIRFNIEVHDVFTVLNNPSDLARFLNTRQTDTKYVPWNQYHKLIFPPNNNNIILINIIILIKRKV